MGGEVGVIRLRDGVDVYPSKTHLGESGPFLMWNSRWIPLTVKCSDSQTFWNQHPLFCGIGTWLPGAFPRSNPPQRRCRFSHRGLTTDDHVG